VILQLTGVSYFFYLRGFKGALRAPFFIMRKAIVEIFNEKIQREMKFLEAEEEARFKPTLSRREFKEEDEYQRSSRTTAEAVEYLKTCAFLIDIYRSNKYYMTTDSRPLNYIPHWSDLSDRDAQIDTLTRALRKFIPLVQITVDEDYEFVLEIPTDYCLEEKMEEYQGRLAHAQEEFAGCESQLAYLKDELNVLKKIKEEV
jgi:hypothetical protein